MGFSTICKRIRIIYQKEKISSLQFLKDTEFSLLENDRDWETAVQYAQTNNNNLTIYVVDVSDSILKEQEEFVVLGDFVSSSFEESKEPKQSQQPEISEMPEIPAENSSALPQVEASLKVAADSLNQFFQNVPNFIGTNTEALSQLFQQMTVAVDSTVESVKPALSQIVANNHSQFEQVACTVKDTVEDVFNAASQNINEYFAAKKENSENYDGPLLEATFVSDVTIPDCSVVAPGQTFTKTWQVKNTGRTVWPDGCFLQFVGGAKMNVQDCVSVDCAKVQEDIFISVDIKAPEDPGRYASYFRLCCPVNGKIPFGTRLWCEIIVKAPEEPFEFPEQLERLVEMGFPVDISKAVLTANKGNFEHSVHQLLA